MGKLLGRLRAVGFVEGVSFLVLVLIAMPLKYTGVSDWPVRIVGGLHGGLWVLFVAMIALTAWRRRWPWTRVAMGLAASVLPAGPFVFDASLRREELAEKTSETPPTIT